MLAWVYAAYQAMIEFAISNMLSGSSSNIRNTFIPQRVFRSQRPKGFMLLARFQTPLPETSCEG